MIHTCQLLYPLSSEKTIPYQSPSIMLEELHHNARGYLALSADNGDEPV